jgi:hypothetical protein
MTIIQIHNNLTWCHQLLVINSFWIRVSKWVQDLTQALYIIWQQIVQTNLSRQMKSNSTLIIMWIWVRCLIFSPNNLEIIKVSIIIHQDLQVITNLWQVIPDSTCSLMFGITTNNPNKLIQINIWGIISAQCKIYNKVLLDKIWET